MVDFSGSRDEAISLICSVVKQLTGQEPDRFQIARGVFYAIGLQALSDVSEAFVVKAQGGTGEDGITWKPLSKKYLAYHRRFGPGEKAALKRAAGLGRAHSRGIGGNQGLLTAAQQKRWRQIYARTLAWTMARFDEGQAKSIAAGHAWNVLKREGAKTMLEVFGNRKVDILRDTGVLLNSLSPGYLEGSDYTPPTGDGGDQQIFRAIRDGIVVGTTVKYANAHDKGLRAPKRQIFPDQIPAAWAQRWGSVAVKAIENAFNLAFREAA